MSEEDRYDYRKVTWGMSQEEVLASEPAAPFHVMPGDVMYRLKMYGKPMTLTYLFAEDCGRIICVAAVIQNDQMTNPCYVNLSAEAESTSGAGQAVQDYQKIMVALEQELGEPETPDTTYRDEEMLEAFKDKTELQEQADNDWEAELLSRLSAAEHSEAQMLSLMRYTRWQTPRTNTTLMLSPVPYGGALLLIKRVSREHAHVFERGSGREPEDQ